MARVLFFLVLSSLFFACESVDNLSNQPEFQKRTIKGTAQGTTYSIVYYSDSSIAKEDIDSILTAIDYSLSNWNKESLLSRFNAGEDSILLDEFFETNLTTSWLIYEATNGAFNPLVKPLIDYYGLGSKSTKTLNIDSARVLEIKLLLDMNAIVLKDHTAKITIENRISSSAKGNLLLLQSKPGLQLDFNAIAQGYSVDVVAEFLSASGITNFLVEIGGEMYASGAHPTGKSWLAGIDKPEENMDARTLQAKLELKNEAIATSGNYRKFALIDGRKVHHTINPNTGYPAINSILSATVISSNCTSADAYATAFMVMGLEGSKQFLSSDKGKDLKAFFIFTGPNDEYLYYYSKGLKEKLEILSN